MLLHFCEDTLKHQMITANDKSRDEASAFLATAVGVSVCTVTACPLWHHLLLLWSLTVPLEHRQPVTPPVR